MHIKRLLRFFAGLCLLAAAFSSLAAAQSERILDFHSDIALREDSSLFVTETIRVISNGAQIRHGIYRDFPTRYKDRLGNRFVVGFTFFGATRDGAPEPARVEDYSNGKRIYLGDSRSFVPTGRHTYTLSYLTTRQLGFFSDHDELYWNVTGNGWAFPIDHASATVRLPPQVPGAKVELSGYTGPQGSMEQSLTSSARDDGAFELPPRGRWDRTKVSRLSSPFRKDISRSRPPRKSSPSSWPTIGTRRSAASDC